MVLLSVRCQLYANQSEQTCPRFCSLSKSHSWATWCVPWHTDSYVGCSQSKTWKHRLEFTLVRSVVAAGVSGTGANQNQLPHVWIRPEQCRRKRNGCCDQPALSWILYLNDTLLVIWVCCPLNLCRHPASLSQGWTGGATCDCVYVHCCRQRLGRRWACTHLAPCLISPLYDF